MRGIVALVLVVLGSATLVPSFVPQLVARIDEPAARAPDTRDPGPSGGGWNRISVPMGPNGHFHLEAMVDGTPVRFLVDSGASAIVLSPEDARRIGLEPGRLRYSLHFRTANGTVRAAPVTLRELRIGQFALSYVEAVVNEAPMPVSLLGTPLLARLSSWTVEGGRLHLYW